MHGGVSPIVVDLGSHTCEAGYAGEDAPKAVFPSVVGAVNGTETMEMDVDSAKTNSNSEILSSIKDGKVSDWDLVDNIWEHAFRLKDKSYANIPTTSYELPDGQTLEIGADKSIVQTIPGMEKHADMNPSVCGLPHMKEDSVCVDRRGVYWHHWAHSNRCGSPNPSTRNMALHTFSENALESSFKILWNLGGQNLKT
ncbi:hypothetical protein Bca4012_055777 [Brassica carinata]